MNLNRIGSRGAQLLAKMLINNQTLEELELSYNEIFNDGLQVLCQGLVQNHGIKRIVLWFNGIEDTAVKHLARAIYQRSQQEYFRDKMIEAIAESQPDYFLITKSNNDHSMKKIKSKQRVHPICEMIVDYLPIYMYFQVDLSHNRKVSKDGIEALLQVSNSDSIAVDGLKDLLSKDRREREIAALAKTSLY